MKLKKKCSKDKCSFVKSIILLFLQKIIPCLRTASQELVWKMRISDECTNPSLQTFPGHRCTLDPELELHPPAGFLDSSKPCSLKTGQSPPSRLARANNLIYFVATVPPDRDFVQLSGFCILTKTQSLEAKGRKKRKKKEK